MHVNIVNPFVDATLNVLETIAFTKVQAGEPHLRHGSLARGDVSGVIELTGEASGTISVSFTENCILPIVSNMLGEEMKQLNEVIRDAVDEITNVICGQARRQLDELGRSLKATIPTVIMGRDHIITHVTTGPIISIPFNTEYGEFTIEVSLGE